MSSLNDALLQQSLGMSMPAGCWKLAPGQVLSLYPRTAGDLWVRHGRVWATLDAHAGGRGAQDHVLQSGERLAVPSGRHLVIEPLDGKALGFEWVPQLAASRPQAQRESLRQPLQDIWVAARLGGGALWRLLRGLLAYPAMRLLTGYRELRGQ